MDRLTPNQIILLLRIHQGISIQQAVAHLEDYAELQNRRFIRVAGNAITLTLERR